MYQVGDYLVYSFEGVCRVVDIGHPQIAGSSKDKLYYALVPHARTDRIYTPVDSGVFMRPVISRESLNDLLQALPTMPVCTDLPPNPRSCVQSYQQILRTHDCARVLQLYKTLYLKQRHYASLKRSASTTDLRCSKQAADMLCSEFGFLLGFSAAQVVQLLHRLIEEGIA